MLGTGPAFFFPVLKRFSFHVYECFACTYVCVVHVCPVPTEPRGGVLDPLERKLHSVGSCQVGGRN